MKKLLLSLTLLFVTGILINETSAQTVELGLRGGVNIASLADSKQEVDSPRIGLLVGVYGKFTIPGTPLSIQSEVLYSQKGAEVNNVEIKRSYIEIPVFVRADFSSSGVLSPHIYAGPYFGFKLDAEPANDSTNDNDFGLTFGVGTGINGFNVGLRYSRGLKEILENEEEKNKAFSIVVGFGF